MSPVVIDFRMLSDVQCCSYACTCSGKDQSSWKGGPVQPQQQMQAPSCFVVSNHNFFNSALSASLEHGDYICAIHTLSRAQMPTHLSQCHAMRRRCAHLLHIRDPALQCKLFDSLVTPILSYASEVWAVDPKAGANAEKVHTVQLSGSS